MENKTEKTPLERKINKDKNICRILKTKEIRYHIGMTDKMQSVDLCFKDGAYEFFLDAGPLNDGTEDGKEKNEEMLKIFNLK
jgi:hypothetical protein